MIVYYTINPGKVNAGFILQRPFNLVSQVSRRAPEQREMTETVWRWTIFKTITLSSKKSSAQLSPQLKNLRAS
jgi:hypothetical protein